MGDDRINRDANLRIWQRIADMEVGNEGVPIRGGHRGRCDTQGQTVMRKQGNAESWKARWAANTIHMVHNFDYVAATDASLTKGREGTKVGYGVFEGVPTRDEYYGTQMAAAMRAHDEHGSGMRETPAMLSMRTGAGMWGGGLPATFEIADAEMYAILEVVRVATRTSTPENGRRCLIMSDSKSCLEQIEEAWRSGTNARMGGQQREAMLAEICERRRQLTKAGGVIVTMWIPGHRGVSCNEYADAVAKQYAGTTVDWESIRSMVGYVKHRTVEYGHTEIDGEWCPTNRSVYKDAIKNKRWNGYGTQWTARARG